MFVRRVDDIEAALLPETVDEEDLGDAPPPVAPPAVVVPPLGLAEDT